MHIEKINIRSITETEYSDIADIIHLKEKKDIFPDSDKRHLAGRFLLYKMAKQIYGADNIYVKYNKNGKPICGCFNFSISHSADYTVCALSDKPIGIDIEKIREIKKREKYRFFSDREAEYINEKNSIVRFFTVWTRKEAYIKAIGEKLSIASKIELIDGNFKLKSEYNKYVFNTDIDGEYIISSAEKC